MAVVLPCIRFLQRFAQSLAQKETIEAETKIVNRASKHPRPAFDPEDLLILKTWKSWKSGFDSVFIAKSKATRISRV